MRPWWKTNTAVRENKLWAGSRPNVVDFRKGYAVLSLIQSYTRTQIPPDPPLSKGGAKPPPFKRGIEGNFRNDRIP